MIHLGFGRNVENSPLLSCQCLQALTTLEKKLQGGISVTESHASPTSSCSVLLLSEKHSAVAAIRGWDVTQLKSHYICFSYFPSLADFFTEHE